MGLRRLRFSVVIPCYNEEAYIGATLKSLSKQSYRGKFEVIVVDNNSTDKTAKIALKHGARVITENRTGVCWARQAGTEAARGQIVVSTDADTQFDKDWLKRIDQTFRDNKSIVGVTGPCRYPDGPWWGKFYTFVLFGAVGIRYRMTGKPFYITATNTAFKKSAWEGYDTALTQGGDEMYLLNQLQQKGKVMFEATNPTFTSSRRLNQGLFYTIFVSFFIYYLLAYNLNKRFDRTILGTAPAYRENTILSLRSPRVYRFVLVSATLILVLWAPIRVDLEHVTYGSFDAASDVIKYLL